MPRRAAPVVVVLAVVVPACAEPQAPEPAAAALVAHARCGLGAPDVDLVAVALEDDADKTSPVNQWSGEFVLVTWRNGGVLPNCDATPSTACYGPAHGNHGDPDVPDFIEDVARYGDAAYHELVERGYDMRPAADGKILIDLSTHLTGFDASALPGDHIWIRAQWVPAPTHGNQERDVETLVLHEMMHLAQLRHYAPGPWPRTGEGWSDPVFDKLRANQWVIEAIARHMERRVFQYPGSLTPEARLLLDSPLVGSNGDDNLYDGFAVFEYLQGALPAIDFPHYYSAAADGWFVPANLPAATTDRVLFDRLATAVPDPAARRALWSRFALGYQYLHADALVPGITTWGWPKPAVVSAPSRMRGDERLIGATGPRPQQVMVTGVDAIGLANGHLATFVVDLEAALCAPPEILDDGRPCSFDTAAGLAAPQAGWQLALQITAPAGTTATIYRTRGTPTAVPTQLRVIDGPIDPRAPVRVAIGDYARDELVVVTIHDDPFAGRAGAGAPVSVAAAFDRPARRIATHWGPGVCAIRDGAVRCAGTNEHGQSGVGVVLPDSTVTPTWVAALSTVQTDGGVPFDDLAWLAGSSDGLQGCARPRGGDVRCWGQGYVHHAVTTVASEISPAMLRDARAIATTHDHACAALANGEVWCAGTNNVGQLGNGAVGGTSLAWVRVVGITGAIQVAVGGSSSCAVLADGALWCWGGNVGGSLGVGATGIAVPIARPVIGLARVAGVAMGAVSSTSCAWTDDGVAWCWGENNRGQVGDGTTTWRTTPVRVHGDEAGGPLLVDEMVTGSRTSCARAATGEAWCWGLNAQGKLGNGTSAISQALRPAPVVALPPVTGLTMSDTTVCAIDADEDVWCWGAWDDGAHYLRFALD